MSEKNQGDNFYCGTLQGQQVRDCHFSNQTHSNDWVRAIAYFGRSADGRLGFTLIEILTASLIVAILAAIAIPSYLNFFQKVSPLCRRESCINRDPKDNKCDKNAITAKYSNFNGIKIELRYSLQCDAAWARSTAPSHSILYVVDSQGQQYGFYKITADKFSEHYGDMGPGVNLNACAKLPNGEVICTDI